MYRLEILKKAENIAINVYEDDVLVEYYEEKFDEPRLEGNIYLGVVKDIIPGMQSAFLDIGEKKTALIHINDLIPKISDKTGNLNLDITKYDINDYVKKKDKIVVQVKKDYSTEKGSRATTDLKIVGQYVILLPNSKFITISQKISKDKKDELVNMVKKYIPKNMGAIIRTIAENADEDSIRQDINSLIALIEDINEAVKSNSDITHGIKLLDDKGILGKLIIDLAPYGLSIVTDNKQIAKYIETIGTGIDIKIGKVQEFTKPDRKVTLKSGGFITIDSTEALVTIDVNSGCYIGHENFEKTALEVNLEATKEIARQIRLRDLGGIIVIDYIDMIEEQSKQKVIDCMNESIKKDRSKIQVVEISKLCLLEMTRKPIFGRKL